MVQKEIKKRPFYDANGQQIGATAALAMGIPGSFADDFPQGGHKFVLTANSAYGWYADDGIVVSPKTGVRYGGSLADSLAIASGASVDIATMGHVFVSVCVGSSKAGIAKGATIYKKASGELTTESAGNTSTTLKVLTPVSYTAAATASAFDASSTYALGDYVTKDSKIYKCTTAITTAAAWDASKWTEVAALPVEQGAENFELKDGKYYTMIVVEL